MVQTKCPFSCAQRSVRVSLVMASSDRVVRMNLATSAFSS